MSGPLWDELAELALAHVTKAGVDYADIRLLDSTTRAISGEDQRIAHIRETSDRGFGIRVLHRGRLGICRKFHHLTGRNPACSRCGPRDREGIGFPGH